jgi:hypothetical protein
MVVEGFKVVGLHVGGVVGVETGLRIGGNDAGLTGDVRSRLDESAKSETGSASVSWLAESQKTLAVGRGYRSRVEV